MKYHLPVLLLALLASFPVRAQRRPQTPVVETTHSIPSAVTPGHTTELTFHNAPSGEPVALWTSFPARTTFIGFEGGQVRCRIDVGPDVPVGIAAVRLYTTGGASSLQLLMIDDLPSTREAADNTSPKTAQPVPTLVAVDGSCEPVLSDFYAITAAKGQRLSIEAVAQRLGSRMDPVLRLLDSTGRELAYIDDSPGAGADARISHRIESAGQYLIEIRDANHEGGPDYRYRLRIGDFPLPIIAFPLVARRGSNAQVAIDTSDAGALGLLTVAIPPDAACASVGVKYPNAKSSGFTSILCASHQNVPPASENTTADKSAALPVPAATSGRFDTPGVRRFYALSLKQGHRIAARARTRSLNSPCDAFLRIIKPDGSKLAQSRSTQADDASLEFTSPADANYLLSVEELSRAAGPGLAFHLEIDHLRPDFALSVESEKVNASAGGTFKLKITATRRDYNGPITLSVAGDPTLTNFELKNATIAKDKKETELEVRVPPEFKPRPLHFTIVGKAKIADAQVERTASTLPALKLLFPRLPYPPPELDGLIALGIKSKP